MNNSFSTIVYNILSSINIKIEQKINLQLLQINSGVSVICISKEQLRCKLPVKQFWFFGQLMINT